MVKIYSLALALYFCTITSALESSIHDIVFFIVILLNLVSLLNLVRWSYPHHGTLSLVIISRIIILGNIVLFPNTSG